MWVGIGAGSFPYPHETGPCAPGAPLEVAVLRPPSRLALALFLLRYPLRAAGGGMPPPDPAVEILHARRLVVRGRHHIGVTTDGEVHRLTPPLAVEIAAAPLRVVLAR